MWTKNKNKANCCKPIEKMRQIYGLFGSLEKKKESKGEESSGEESKGEWFPSTLFGYFLN